MRAVRASSGVGLGWEDGVGWWILGMVSMMGLRKGVNCSVQLEMEVRPWWVAGCELDGF